MDSHNVDFHDDEVLPSEFEELRNFLLSPDPFGTSLFATESNNSPFSQPSPSQSQHSDLSTNVVSSPTNVNGMGKPGVRNLLLDHTKVAVRPHGPNISYVVPSPELEGDVRENPTCLRSGDLEKKAPARVPEKRPLMMSPSVDFDQRPIKIVRLLTPELRREIEMKDPKLFGRYRKRNIYTNMRL